MGLNNLAARSDGQTVQADDVNQYRNAFIGNLVPRNASGSAENQQGDLGTASLQWENLYIAGNIVVNGSVLDFSELGGESNRIISGEEATGGDGAPGYLGFVSATTTGRILGVNTDLALSINNTPVTISTNIDITGLAVAPSSNNTCVVNNAALAGAVETKYLGEDGGSLTIGTIGSEITALDGTIQCFRKGSEYFLALVDASNNRLFPFIRGVAGSSRETLSNGNTITLMSASYIFVADDGSSTYRTTIHPTFDDADPAGVSNQWYFNTTTKRWRQYSGSWSNVDVAWLGFVICDSSAAVAAQSMDFSLRWNSDLEGDLIQTSASKIRVQIKRASVAGRNFQASDFGQEIDLSVSGDRETGVTESPSTTYYIYIDRNLKPRFSDVAPRVPDQRLGMYHPFRYWRYVGYAINDSASDIRTVVFNGDTKSFRDARQLTPGALGTTAPVYVDSSSFSVSRIDTVDSTGLVHLFKNAPTTVSMGSNGLNGIAQSADLTGTITVSSSSPTVTGVGTTFLSDFIAGDVIRTNGGQTRIVQTVNNDLSITTTTNFSGNESGVVYRRGGEVNDAFYFLYTVGDGENAGLLLSTRNVAGAEPLLDLPGGYLYYRQEAFALKNNGSGDIIPFAVVEGWPNRTKIRYITNMPSGLGITTDTSILTSGTATTFTAISVASYAPPIAISVNLAANSPNTIRSDYRPTGTSLTQGMPITISSGTSCGQANVSIGTGRSIDYKVSSNNVNVAIESYVIGEV